MDGDPFGTEARDDQGDLATDARPAPLLCLDRGGTTARRSGVNAVRVSSRQSAGDGTRRDDRRPTARVARRHGTAAPVRPAAGAGIRPASTSGFCAPTDFTGLVPPLGTHRGKPRGGGAGTRSSSRAAKRVYGPGRHAGCSRVASFQAATARGPGHSPGGACRGPGGGHRGGFHRTDGLDPRPPADGISGGSFLPVRDHDRWPAPVRLRLGGFPWQAATGGGERHNRGRGREAGVGTRQPAASGPLTCLNCLSVKRPRRKPGPIFLWEALAAAGEGLFTFRKKWGQVGADGRLSGPEWLKVDRRHAVDRDLPADAR